MVNVASDYAPRESCLSFSGVSFLFSLTCVKCSLRFKGVSEGLEDQQVFGLEATLAFLRSVFTAL